MSPLSPPTFLETCKSVNAIAEIDWDGQSKTCLCTVLGKYTHDKRRKTFSVQMSEMDKVWPYASQALRVILFSETIPKYVAKKLIAYCSGMPTGYTGPVWFGLGVLPWNEWDEISICTQDLHASCTLRGPASGRPSANLLLIYERNYPHLATVLGALDPFGLDAKDLATMLKGFLQPPLDDAVFDEQPGRPNVMPLLTKLHEMGMPAIFLIEALKNTFTADATPVALPLDIAG